MAGCSIDLSVSEMKETQVFSVRLAILSLATPVFLLFSLVALVGGLVRRDLSHWGGGRETSFVYHYAKKAVLPLVVITWVTYLALTSASIQRLLCFPSPHCLHSP